MTFGDDMDGQMSKFTEGSVYTVTQPETTLQMRAPGEAVCSRGLPVLGYESFDAVHFPLLVSLLLWTQHLLLLGLHVTLWDQHFVWHRKLQKYRESISV